MALCLAASLLECRGFDALDQMQRYVRWWREGYMSATGRNFDIGNTVRASLARFEATGDPYAGTTDRSIAGNGSLMRLAPVPMYYAADAAEAIDRAAMSSSTTHGAPQAVDACRYFAGLLVGALIGVDKRTLLAAGYCPVDGLRERNPLDETIAEVAEGSFAKREPPEIVGSGYVVRALEAALWAFNRSSDFREGSAAGGQPGRRRRHHRRDLRPDRRGVLRGGGHPDGVALATRDGRHDNRDGGRSVRGVRDRRLTGAGGGPRAPCRIANSGDG